MFKHRFTVFTPAYNRSQTLERLYRSLQAQTFTDFEWLVIDDGSTDDTEALVKKWAAEKNAFPIYYYFKTNGGKHTAINFGLEKAQGELFFTADSDDYLTDDALEKVHQWAAALPRHEKYCGVVGNMGTSRDKTPNSNFDGKWREANILERYQEVSNRPLDGERVYVFFTAVHKQYSYPEFKNEKFMTEAVAWNRMANDGYKMRVYNDIIYIYKFLPNGLSLSGASVFIENPKGFGLWLKEKAQYCNYSTSMKLQIYYTYYCSQQGQWPLREIASNIGTSYFVMWWIKALHTVKKMCNRFR